MTEDSVECHTTEESDQYHTTEEALEPITGKRTGNCIYIWQDEFIFIKNRESPSLSRKVFYMRCNENSCRATITCRAISLIVVASSPHNHPPRTNEVLKLRFYDELRRCLRDNPQRTAKYIFNDVATDTRFKNIVSLIRREPTITMLRRVRRNVCPMKKEKRPKTHYGISTPRSRTNKLKQRSDKSQENEDDETIREEEDHQIDLFLKPSENPLATNDEAKCDDPKNNSLLESNANDKLNSTTALKDKPDSVTAESEQTVSSPKKFDEVSELTKVVNKLEKISKKLSAVAFDDKYDHFGKYIGTLLRGLPQERAQRIMLNIVSDVMSAQSGFEQRAQAPQDDTSESPPEHLESNQEVTANNDVEFVICQVEDETLEDSSSSLNKDQQLSYIEHMESSFSDCFDSRSPVSASDPLTNNNQWSSTSNVISKRHSVRGIKGSSKLAEKRYKIQVHQDSSVPPEAILIDCATDPFEKNERRRICFPEIDEYSEKPKSCKTSEAVCKENSPSQITSRDMCPVPPSTRSSNHATEVFLDNKRLKKRFSKGESSNIRVVECDPLAVVQDVVMKEHPSVHSAAKQLFVCTACSIYFQSTNSLHAHILATHPDQFQKVSLFQSEAVAK